MKKIFVTLILVVISTCAFSQDKPKKKSPYQFTDVYRNFATETKNQCKTGTCWSFATTSFIESEILRLGHGERNISEMYNVRMTYPKKAEMYMRYQGKNNFSAGSLSHDVLESIDKYGIVPEEAYMGRNDEGEDYNHGEMDKVLKNMMDAVIENGHASEHWKDAVDAVLDVYLGEIPESFDTGGSGHTPIAFKEAMEIKVEEYVNLTSFTHHPFYEEFILEVPDNFSQGKFQNVKMKELTETVKNALKHGFTVAWDADVSETGFSFKNGMAIAPKDESLRRGELFKKIEEEMTATQEKRQEGFDNFDTTDDHLMHIMGLAKDQDDNEYFIIKNSWGSDNPYEGKQYVSMPYFELKTISILLHQDGLKKELLDKLN
ncbi:MAG: bleomycin hydrolase [Patiriisocius sp.]|jgi:bleomycin hydrolase